MGKSFHPQTDAQRHHRAATSEAMRRMAVRNQCPKCHRKAAVKRRCDGDLSEKWCRWCDWGVAVYLSEGK